MSTYEADGLRLKVQADHEGMAVHFEGRSDKRHPATTLVPWFEEILPQLSNQQVHVEFRNFEYMNSSSFMPIFQFLRDTASRATGLRVTYDASKDWQRLSFSSLSALAAGWSNFSIEAQ